MKMQPHACSHSDFMDEKHNLNWLYCANDDESKKKKKTTLAQWKWMNEWMYEGRKNEMNSL